MLIGRAEERDELVDLLEGARRGVSAAVIVHGEPGIGKSTLLEHLVEGAGGFRILHTRPLESEAELPFAGLSDLLRPLLPLLDRLPDQQAAALSGALALGPPALGDRFAVAAATLSMLAAGAEEKPLLVAVDDAHWLDGPSREAILFAARRLDREGVIVALAARERPWLASAGLTRLEVSSLTASEARSLIDVTGRDVSATVQQQVIRETAGNPLAILQALGTLTDAQLDGDEPITGPLPVGAEIEESFSRRLELLQRDTRRALLVAAASDSGDLVEIAKALETLDLDRSTLDPASDAGLITIRESTVEFGHPLIRSAVYHSVEPSERIAAHRALALTLPSDLAGRIAWHLASAARGPDEEVASLLEASAAAAQARLAHASAARAYETAARLSPQENDRMRRTISAAQAHWLGGDPTRADELLVAALPSADPRLRAEIQLLRAGALFFVAPVSELFAMLVTESERISADDPARAAGMLCQAASCYLMAGELTESIDTARHALALAAPLGGPITGVVAGVLAGMLAMHGDMKESTALLAPFLPMLDVIEPAGEASQHLALIAQVLSFLEDYDRADRVLRRVIHSARVASSASLLPFPLAVLADHELRVGRVTAAHAAAEESVRLAHETGQSAGAAFSLVTLARVEAILGLEELCRRHVAAARAIARRVGATTIEWYGESVLGLLDLSLGNLEEAYAHASEAARLERKIAVGLPVIVPLRPDLVEAAIRLGRIDDATRELEVLEAQSRQTGVKWASATAARCRGLIADETSYEAIFAEALALHGDSSPWERARTEFCLGQRRRRSRRRADARASLLSALATFESLGADPWVEATRAELRATGVTVEAGDDRSLRNLTPQELQVALTVARGSTTKQAAAALFLSPKTIEFHLGNVYRKLGLSSRTELVRRIEHLDSGSPATPAPAV